MEEGIVESLSEFDKSKFLQRLKLLQNLCSGRHPDYPRGILCVPGPDGRGNKGSLMIVKYLFQLAVGKELYESMLNDRYECLEEIIIWIQDTNISLIVTAEIKRVLQPFLSICPFVTVYSSPGDKEEEVDEFQARKAATFKKLMLTSIQQGEVVGIPIPLGYDSVLDVENWSLMRSFALETVVTASGFFTSTYTVIDVTEALDSLFRSVDSSVVLKAIEIVKKSVVPNVHQSLRILSGRGTNENRLKLTSEELTSPLEFLFDFGELESVFTPDPLLKPVALFAQLSNSIGNMPDHVKLSAPWKNAKIPEGCVHVVIEGCEPSTGMRWCRTYFTQRGRMVNIVADPESLVSSESSILTSRTPAMADDINRLETMYILLWDGLRRAVRSVFGRIDPEGEIVPSIDVVTAGSLVEDMVKDFMKSHLPNGFAKGEVLRIYMDCMNGIGQKCALEEVEDIGGQCFAFIRVSVHGIVTSGLSQPVAVAVGDTFLFSPHNSQIRTLICPKSDSEFASDNTTALMHLQDAFCITHVVPYMHGTFGVGSEEAAAHHLLHSAGSTHLLSWMKLGNSIEAHGSSAAYTFPLLTDHASNPYYPQAELGFFDSGLMVERLNGATLPAVVSFETHVVEMWTVDLLDVYHEAARQNGDNNSTHWVDLPEGLVVIIKLKESRETRTDGMEQKEEFGSSGGHPFDSFLPQYSTVRHIAFVVRSDMPSSSGYYSRAVSSWKRALRTNEIPDHRGLGPDSSLLPSGILNSFLALYDYWGVMGGSSSTGAQDIIAAVNIPRNLSDHDGDLEIEDMYGAASGPVTLPGAGYLPLKSLFMVCENARIYTAECDMIKSVAKVDVDNAVSTSAGKRHVNIVAVIGLPGSTTPEVAAALLPRLPDNTQHMIADCSNVSVGVNTLAKDVGIRIENFSNKHSSSDNILLSLILSAEITSDLPLFLDNCVDKASQGSSAAFGIKFTLSVVSNPQLISGNNVDHEIPLEEQHFSNNRIGNEMLTGAAFSLCRFGISDAIVCVDNSTHGYGFSALRKNFRQIRQSSISNTSSFVGEIPLFRLRPPLSRLDDDLVDVILFQLDKKESDVMAYSKRIFTLLNTSNVSLCHPFTKVAEAEISEDGISVSKWLNYRHLVNHSRTGIEKFRTQELTSVPSWRDIGKGRDLEMVTSCLRAIFPKASVSPTVSPDIWSVPEPERGSIGTVRRIMQLATAKVIGCKQMEVNRSRLSCFLSRKVNPELRGRVQSRLCSLSGFINLPPGSNSFAADTSKPISTGGSIALIDACRDFISIRVVTDCEFERLRYVTDTNLCGHLVVSGYLGTEELDFVDNLFSQCFLCPMERKQHIEFSDLSEVEILQHQQQNSHVELPGGCWFDGHAFIDVSGTKSRFRPDIRDICAPYIEKSNFQIDIYNKLISATESYQ